MIQSAATLARYRLQRANEAFEGASTSASAGSWNGALNRLYYTAYYAARALLATRGIDSGRHSAAISLFQLHFVKSGVIQTDLARVLPKAFELRQEADYSDYEQANEDDVSQLRPAVATFLAACGRAVEEALAIG